MINSCEIFTQLYAGQSVPDVTNNNHKVLNMTSTEVIKSWLVFRENTAYILHCVKMITTFMHFINQS